MERPSASSFWQPLLLMLGPLGIVFGDIGTSPLYAFREAAANVSQTQAHALGIASAVFWALVLVVFIKYTLVIMRADHDGEGGIFALLGLLKSHEHKLSKRKLAWVTVAIIIGAALLYGDGVITPAISVLSAWEGLEVVHPSTRFLVLPLTLLTLLALFAVQRQGTERIGKVFGYVMALWFIVLAALGIPWILKHPVVLHALDPRVAIGFLSSLSLWGYLHVVGAITLCITGGEALYADMGHFDRKRVRFAWMFVVFPALTLNYLGQAARLLEPGWTAGGNLFYALAPPALVLPLVILATAATIIASQALITGVFSLTNQAMQMSLFPRMSVVYTSLKTKGQIYMPGINKALCVGTLALVILFGSSSALSGAYGFAVAGTMVITTIAFVAVAIYVLEWSKYFAISLGIAFLLLDLQFFGANVFKFAHGGYVPVFIALVLTAIMMTWVWGRTHMSDLKHHLEHRTMPWLIDLKRRVEEAGGVLHDKRGMIAEVNRAVVYLSSVPVGPEDNVPLILRLFLKRYAVLPKYILVLHVDFEHKPFIEDDERYEVAVLGHDVYSITAKFGYMEQPHVRVILDQLLEQGVIGVTADKWIIEVGEDELVISKDLDWPTRLKAKLFYYLHLVATPLHYYLGLGIDSQDKMTIEKTVVPVEIRKGGVHLVGPVFRLADEADHQVP